MKEDVIYLTPQGRADLEKELNHLKTVCRTEIAEKLRSACENANIFENPEFDCAKEEQQVLEKRILLITQTLRDAQIIVGSDTTTSMVTLGVTVKLYDVMFDEEIDYEIVGTVEANPSKGRISNLSPLGRAIMGQSVGTKVTIVAPDGEQEYIIREICA